MTQSSRLDTAGPLIDLFDRTSFTRFPSEHSAITAEHHELSSQYPLYSVYLRLLSGDEGAIQLLASGADDGLITLKAVFHLRACPWQLCSTCLQITGIFTAMLNWVSTQITPMLSVFKALTGAERECLIPNEWPSSESPFLLKSSSGVEFRPLELMHWRKIVSQTASFCFQRSLI